MVKCCLERKLIGEILVERGFITVAALNNALECQKRSPDGYVGEILLRQGALTEIDIVTALVIQCNLPYIAISKHAVDADVIKLIPAKVACDNKLVPLDRIGSILSIVMLRPIEDSLRSQVESLTGCKIAMFISTRTEIDSALARFYPTEKACF